MEIFNFRFKATVLIYKNYKFSTKIFKEKNNITNTMYNTIIVLNIFVQILFLTIDQIITRN